MSYLSYLLTLCSLYQFLSPYQSFVVLSNFCHLLAPCYLITFYVIFSSYKCTAVHTTHNSFSCLIVRTLSAPIQLSYSPCAFGQRAILTIGGSDRGWGFPHRTNRYVLESPFIYPTRPGLRGHAYKYSSYCYMSGYAADRDGQCIGGEILRVTFQRKLANLT